MRPVIEYRGGVPAKQPPVNAFFVGSPKGSRQRARKLLTGKQREWRR
jgi:hypothetical protein